MPCRRRAGCAGPRGRRAPSSPRSSGEPEPKRRRRLKKFLIFGGLPRSAALVCRKLRRPAEADNWQSSYVPAPAAVAPRRRRRRPTAWPTRSTTRCRVRPLTTRAAPVPARRCPTPSRAPRGHHARRAGRGRRGRRARARPARSSRVTRVPPTGSARAGGARPRARGRSIHASIRSHQPKSHSIRSSRSCGDLGALDRPPAHHDALVHRQLAPDVADGEHVVEPGVRDQDDVGVGRAVEGGQEAAGAWGEHVGHLLGALRPSSPGRACAAARCRARGRLGVKLPPSGKITNASFSSRPVASAAIWLSRSSPAAGWAR